MMINRHNGYYTSPDDYYTTSDMLAVDRKLLITTNTDGALLPVPAWETCETQLLLKFLNKAVED